MILNQPSIIAILGGAGKAGYPLVQQALKAGYRVRLLLRHPEHFDLADSRLTIIQGDARDPAAIHQLLNGCSAVLSTLGNPRGEQVPMLSTVTALLLSAMRELGITRYVVVSSYYETGAVQHDAKTKQAADYMQQHFPSFMADRKRELDLLLASLVDWTYVRLPYVVQETPTGKINVEQAYLPGQQISAIDLASFLTDILDNHRFIRQTIFVANG